MAEHQGSNKPKILIVEDEAIIAVDLKSHLEHLGYAVLAHLNSAEKALGLIEQAPPDLVLMDIVLKGKMDGIEAADLIRSRWDIPIVFLTAYADHERLDRAKLVYPFGYIIKPFQDNDLKITIEMALFVSKVDKERRKAEEALRESEKKYHELFDFLPIPVYEMDLETNITSANRAIYEIFRGSEEDLKKGLKAWQLISPEEIEKSSRNIQRLLKGEPVEDTEYTLRRLDGSVFPAIVISSAIYRDGKPVGLRGAIVDITDRKQAEEGFRQSEARYRTLVEESFDGIFIQRGSKIVFANQRLHKMLGYQEGELEGRDHWVVYHPDYQSIALKRAQARMSGEEALSQYEVKLQCKDGTTFDGEVRARAILFGQEPGIQVWIRDITERKRAEEERDKLQEQLFQAQKMESVGRLAGGVAHDFNNLLTAIIGNAEMALMDEDKEGAKAEVLGEIIKAGERAAGLTRQLLAFSRKQVIQPEVADLNEVVSEMAKILRRLIGEDIELTTILAPDPGRVEVDVGQIEQVIMNLAVNARDSMPGGGKLTIETADVELDEEYAAGRVAVRSGPYVLLSVSDNGIGMTSEVQEQIFEPFFTTKEKGRGTGLGLATVYGIVKQSRGNIWVYSEPGQGTTFKIYLPRLDKSVEEVKRPGPKAEFRGGSETVLLVEDEEGIRNLALKMLQRFGYHVLTAKDGQEAREVFERHGGPIDLLLTDVIMPRMSGRELAERLEGLQAGIKVLFMSGYTDNAIVHHGILDKGIAFIQKPFTPEELVRMVREVLDS
ncbi:MAG: PAS domain S-box protein [Pseudomonadota bacterium]